jgi:hypothetical protein
LTEEEVKALEALDTEGLSLPEGADTHFLAETAKSILGLGSGREKKKREKEEVPAEED